MVRERRAELTARVKILQAALASAEQELKAIECLNLPSDDNVPIWGGDSTIKGLALNSLKEAFPNGATVSELFAYMVETYGRPQRQSSLSPQLSRLKAEGMIDLSDGVWKQRC